MQPANRHRRNNMGRRGKARPWFQYITVWWSTPTLSASWRLVQPLFWHTVSAILMRIDIVIVTIPAVSHKPTTQTIGKTEDSPAQSRHGFALK